MRVARLALLCALVAAPATSARADDGMRCGQWLVARGATEGEVAKKCGPPTEAHRERVYDTTDDGLVVGYVVIDRWTYDRGPSEFVRTAIFRSGTLVDVDVGTWGN